MSIMRNVSSQAYRVIYLVVHSKYLNTRDGTHPSLPTGQEEATLEAWGDAVVSMT